jgi:uncharacterized membrane protein
MHLFRSPATIRRMRVAAFALIVTALLVLVSILTLVVSWTLNHHEMMVGGAYLLSSTILMIVVQWFCARLTHCPLCMAAVMAKNGCSRHRRAKTLLGSHRLRVALAILAINRFTCPYCNEKCLLVLRTLL